MGWYGIAVFYTIGLIIFSYWAYVLNGKENEVTASKKIVKTAKLLSPTLDTNAYKNIFDFMLKPKVEELYKHPDKYTVVPIGNNHKRVKSRQKNQQETNPNSDTTANSSPQ